MRAIVTGPVGMDKKAYLEEVAALAGNRGEGVTLFHVGDLMYAEAPDVPPGRILDLPWSRLHSLRRSVFKDIITDSADLPNVVVNTHATFRWRHGLFRAFDFDQIEKFKPDMVICMVDNVEAIHHRLRSEHHLDARLKDMIVWREEEILASDLLALAVGCQGQCYILPRGRSAATIETCFRLICRPDMRKGYMSFPMTHVAGMPDVLADIDAFKAALSRHFITFDPADVDEKELLDHAIAAAKEGRDFIDGAAVMSDGSPETFRVSVKEVLEIASDIDGQIYARDFLLIDQSDMIVSLVPELAGGRPGVSSGVERELQHAYEHGKEVYVIWTPKGQNPSPFITKTATRVFNSTEQALAFFDETGMTRTHSLFGN